VDPPAPAVEPPTPAVEISPPEDAPETAEDAAGPLVELLFSTLEQPDELASAQPSVTEETRRVVLIRAG
jgi:hypothetical protein